MRAFRPKALAADATARPRRPFSRTGCSTFSQIAPRFAPLGFAPATFFKQKSFRNDNSRQPICHLYRTARGNPERPMWESPGAPGWGCSRTARSGARCLRKTSSGPCSRKWRPSTARRWSCRGRVNLRAATLSFLSFLIVSPILKIYQVSMPIRLIHYMA
jgi:hypothetical protein